MDSDPLIQDSDDVPVFFFLKQDRNVYCEDWGEALTNKSSPVICVVDLQSGTVRVLHGVPKDVSPGQVRSEKLHLTMGLVWSCWSQSAFVLEYICEHMFIDDRGWL